MVSTDVEVPQAIVARLREAGRLQVLSDLKLFDGPVDGDFNRLARLAAGLFSADTAAVVLVDAEREFCAGSIGTIARHGRLGFAAQVVGSDKAWLLQNDPAHPGELRVGAPVLFEGQRIGALIAQSSTASGPPSPAAIDQLTDLAAMATAVMTLKREARVRARTAAELMREEWRHALTLEAGQVGSWIWDTETGMVTCNDILRRMFDVDAVGDIDVEALFAAIDPADLPAVTEGIDRTFEEGIDFAAEYRVASGRWLSSRGRVYQRSADGRPLVMMGISIDISEARNAADHTRHLLLELNHRVKNTLAMTQSIARQTLRHNPDPQTFIDTFSGRIRTLADAHELLADRDWAGIMLTQLVKSQVMRYAPANARRLQIDGPELQLPPDQALGLGIVLHELASNAARFGALSPGGGQVEIFWVLEDGILTLDWRESGGPAVAERPVRGFGSRLIERSLDKVLGSNVLFEMPREGVRTRITLPVADLSASAQSPL